MLELRRALAAAGHRLNVASKTLLDLKRDPKRVARMVRANPAKAWIVESAPRSVLAWFAQEKIPTFALFGTMTNLPDWEETPAGLRRCLDSLFAVTPPTAIFIIHIGQLLTVENYLARHRGRELRNVTLISTDYHQHYEWCDPPIPHFKWEPEAAVRRVVKWLEDLASGKVNRRQRLIKARFVGAEAVQTV